MTDELNWQEPLIFARNYAGYESFILLHSSLQHPDYGKYSILAVGLEEEISNDLSLVAEKLKSKEQSNWNKRWFGFIGYEAGRASKAENSPISLPDSWFGQFSTVFVFDHQAKALHRYGAEIAAKPAEISDIPKVTQIKSNMSKTRYLQVIEDTLEQIRAGEFYQANITRKFFGEFASEPEPLSVFEKLCAVSPASYGAYIQHNGKAILSSSPECFLTMDEAGRVESRPIKGTAARDTNPELLEKSEKDRAENLMIVDLMRNDLSQYCEVGTVETHKLFEVTSYATLHHMASTIIGQRKANISSIELAEGCFPPGSMTGAPKKAVLQWCEQQEAMKRGVYSGVLGWISPNGAADLSVVIRTLVIEDEQFEFQMGGGIVHDSLPEKEWRETLTKAKGIAQTLNIPPEHLEF